MGAGLPFGLHELLILLRLFLRLLDAGLRSLAALLGAQLFLLRLFAHDAVRQHLLLRGATLLLRLCCMLLRLLAGGSGDLQLRLQRALGVDALLGLLLRGKARLLRFADAFLRRADRPNERLLRLGLCLHRLLRLPLGDGELFNGVLHATVGLGRLTLGLLARPFRFVGALCLLRKSGLSVELSLRHLFDENPPYLHVFDVAVIDELLLNALDELWLRDPAALGRDLREVARVAFKNAFENGVIGNQACLQLEEVFLVKLQRSVDLLDAIAQAVVALQKLPELIALTVIWVLHQQVRALNRTAYSGAARHQRAKGAGPQTHDHTAYAVDTHEHIHVLVVVLREALPVFDLHFKTVLDRLIGVVDLALHGKRVHRLIAGRPENEVRALIDERHEALDQMVNKAVLIQVVAVLRGDVQNFCWLNVAVLVGGDELCVLAEMAHTVRRDLLRQRHRHDLLARGNKAARVGDDGIDGVKAVLDGRKPLLVHHFMQQLVVLGQRGASGLRHGKQVLEIAVLLQRRADLVHIFQI